MNLKEYNIPTIQAWESMDFPWNVPQATPSDIPRKIHTLPRLDGRYAIYLVKYRCVVSYLLIRLKLNIRQSIPNNALAENFYEI